MTEAWTYRRDRWGEDWHIVPDGERGVRGRTVCGEPRQGTPLSEGYSAAVPPPPERICLRCAALAPSRGIPVGKA